MRLLDAMLFCSSLRTGKVNAYGWLRYSGFARHKDPQLDAAGALADLLVFSLNLTGLDIIEKNPLAALQAFAIASGWEQSSFMRRHFLGRALVRRI